MSEMATKDQIAEMAMCGIPYRTAVRVTKDWAAEAILKCTDRHRKGLCTYRTAVFLRRYGVDPTKLTHEQAKDAIMRLVESNDFEWTKGDPVHHMQTGGKR